MLKQPVGMKVYTNVSIVRLKLGKGTFEIACYPNKVQDYRYKKEKDMKEVLQTREIFKNAIKGDLVPQKELKEVFPNMTKDDILKLILEKGAIQTGEKERETESSNLKKNIAFTHNTLFTLIFFSSFFNCLLKKTKSIIINFSFMNHIILH